MDGEVVPRSDSVRDLGVLFDSKLTFSDHICSITTTAMKTLGFIIRTCRGFHDITAMKTLYYAYVRSKLEYCSVVWYPQYHIYKDMIEAVQRKFLKFLAFKRDGVYPLRGCDHGLLLNWFEIDSLECRRKVMGITFLYKLVHGGVDCSDLLALLNFRVPDLRLRHGGTFYDRAPRTNLVGPLTVMCRNFDIISRSCDLNNCSIYFLRRLSVEAFR